MNEQKKERKGWFEREAWISLLLNLWPLLMFIIVLVVFLLRISMQ